jgi:hemolysin activation/secretion protein
VKVNVFLWVWLGSVCLGMPSSFAVSIPLQDNPVFWTPPMEEVKLGPVPPMPFKTVLQHEVPPTEMKDVETHQAQQLESVYFQGNRFYNNSTIARSLKVLETEQANHLDASALEATLTRINRQNPFKLSARLVPGHTEAAKSLHVTVYEQQPWQITSTFDNQGRPRIGTLRGGVQLINESLLGFGDKLTIQYTGAEGTKFLHGFYEVPVNGHGGTITALTEYSRHDVNGLAQWNRQPYGEQVGLGLRYTQPIGKQRHWTADIGAIGRHINLIQSQPIHADPRFVFAGLRFNKPDKWGSTNIHVQHFLGNDEWLGGDSKFYRLRGNATRIINLPKSQQLILKAAFQHSPDALIPLQMMPITGSNFVRGYREGLLYGDSGQFYSAEYRYPIPFLKQTCPWLSDRVRGVAFFDYAQAVLSNSRVTMPEKKTAVMSAGLGVRFRLTQYVQGFVDVAWGIGNQPNFEKQNLWDDRLTPSTRVHFGLRSQWLPKDYHTARVNTSSDKVWHKAWTQHELPTHSTQVDNKEATR